VGDGNLVVRQH